MAKLEDLTVGAMVNGLVNNESVQIVAEMGQEEENVAEQSSAARTIKELNLDIATLKALESHPAFQRAEKKSFMEINRSFGIAELSRHAEIIY